jgi:tetratricopeptide (TPR) repeat protein
MAAASSNQNSPDYLGVARKLINEKYIDPFCGVDISTQLGLSDKYFSAVYALAVKYYDNNRLDEALKMAYQLTQSKPSEHKYYKLLGACLQAKEDYASALKVYQGSIAFAFLDAETYFYVGQCQFLTKQFADASKSLGFAKHLCEKYPEQWAHIKTQVIELLNKSLERATSQA